jgi:hypothetical protein
MEKNSYIFICNIPQHHQYFAGRKEDIDRLITQFEQDNEDLPFTTIAKVKEPPQGLPLGFPENLIEWYDKKGLPEREVIDAAVLGVVIFLQRGFQF